MKKYKLTILFISFLLFSCEMDLNNPNAATEEETLNSKEGLFALSIGIKYKYSSDALKNLLPMSGLTTREIALGFPNENTKEFQKGGENGINGENAWLVGIWSELLSVKIMSEKLLKNVEKINMEADIKSGLIAYASFFKAIAIGKLITHFEYVPINFSEEGNSEFYNKEECMIEILKLTSDGIKILEETPFSDEFKNAILGKNFDLKNCLYAYLARYNLIYGNYQEAIDNANKVNINSISIFEYDASTANPIFQTGIGAQSFVKAVDNFGLPQNLHPENNDARIGFYMSPDTMLAVDSELPIENLKGFFDEANKFIPVFLPGEIYLIKAEAYARMEDLNSAVKNINIVRKKTDDIYGVNAMLPEWDGNEKNKEEILDEIYKNRCIELFMQAMRLEDSKRFGRLEPPLVPVFTSERNRNYYPYPKSEHLNNIKTPEDPSI